MEIIIVVPSQLAVRSGKKTVDCDYEKGQIIEITSLVRFSQTYSEITFDGQTALIKDLSFAILHPMPKIQIAFPFETVLTVTNPLTSEEVDSFTLEAGEPLDVQAVSDGIDGTKSLYLGDFRMILDAPGNLYYI